MAATYNIMIVKIIEFIVSWEVFETLCVFPTEFSQICKKGDNLPCIDR